MNPRYRLAIPMSALLIGCVLSGCSGTSEATCADARQASKHYWDEGTDIMKTMKQADEINTTEAGLAPMREALRLKMRTYSYVVQQNSDCFSAQQRAEAQRFLDIPPVPTR